MLFFFVFQNILSLSNVTHSSKRIRIRIMDWPGLLKFSLTHTDGTKPSQFHEMDQDTKKWLEEAIQHYSQSEVKRISEILQEIGKEELYTKEDEERKTALLEELEELIESLGQGDVLYALGPYPVLKVLFSSKYTSSRVVAARIFCFANQNDAKVQTESINLGSLEVLERVTTEELLPIKQAMMSCLSSLIRGENLEAKRIFIRIKGLQLLESVLTNSPSKRIKDKGNNILRDLLFYDNNLHSTFNDLSSFTNTNSLKSAPHTSLYYDANKEVASNILEENKKYKGYISHWLAEHPEIKIQHEEWLKAQMCD